MGLRFALKILAFTLLLSYAAIVVTQFIVTLFGL